MCYTISPCWLCILNITVLYHHFNKIYLVAEKEYDYTEYTEILCGILIPGMENSTKEMYTLEEGNKVIDNLTAKD